MLEESSNQLLIKSIIESDTQLFLVLTEEAFAGLGEQVFARHRVCLREPLPFVVIIARILHPFPIILRCRELIVAKLRQIEHLAEAAL
jgi:hypothetical protein